MTEQKLPSDYLEQGWCQGYFARDEHFFERDPLSEEASAWCLIGARFRAFGNSDYESAQRYWIGLREVVADRYGDKYLVAEVNDDIYLPETGQAQAVADAREAERRAGLR